MALLSCFEDVTEEFIEAAAIGGELGQLSNIGDIQENLLENIFYLFFFKRIVIEFVVVVR